MISKSCCVDNWVIKSHMYFCKGAQNTSECHVVTDIGVRKNILKREGRSHLCLRGGGHLTRDCQSFIKWFTCKGRHHVALCESRRRPSQVSYNKGRSEENRSSSFSRRQVDQGSQTNSAKPSTSLCGMNLKGNLERKGYLLQTAFVIAANPEDPSKEVKVSDKFWFSNILCDPKGKSIIRTTHCKSRRNYDKSLRSR